MSANTRRQPTGDSAPPLDSGPAAPSADGTPGAGAGATTARDESGRSERRSWSARRIPAALVALLSAAATGLLLYDVIAVRAGRTAMGWRRRLAEELATRPLDDTWMIVGAAVAMVLGLWLFLLAVTPGLRRLLPMQPAHRYPRDGGGPGRARPPRGRPGSARPGRAGARCPVGTGRCRPPEGQSPGTGPFPRSGGGPRGPGRLAGGSPYVPGSRPATQADRARPAPEEGLR